MAFLSVDQTLFVEIIESRTNKCQYKCKYKVSNVIQLALIATPGIAFVQRTICGIERQGGGDRTSAAPAARMTVALAGAYGVQ